MNMKKFVRIFGDEDLVDRLSIGTSDRITKSQKVVVAVCIALPVSMLVTTTIGTVPYVLMTAGTGG
jgi:hypothetical protein